MKTEWISYGPDIATNAGWKVLGKSSGLSAVLESQFLTLCRSVLQAGLNEAIGRCYFGGGDGKSTLICRGDYAGKDAFGREGAWIFHGFDVSQTSLRILPCRWADALLNTLKQGESEAIEFDAEEVASPNTRSLPELKKLYTRQRELTFVIYGEELREACDLVDGLSDMRRDVSGYAMPLGELPNKTKGAAFSIVGICPLAESVVPLKGVVRARQRSKLLSLVLLITSVLAIAFGVWSQLDLQTQKHQNRDIQERLQVAERPLHEMRRKAFMLLDMLTEQGVSVKSVLETDHVNIEAINIKVGPTTYTFTRDVAAEVFRRTSDLVKMLNDLVAIQE